jgi:multiple sugar transport system ATP-binding protein
VVLSDASAFRGMVFGAEYLGTTQIVTVTTDRGAVKARLPSQLPVRTGEQVGLAFRPEKLSLFARSSGRAIRSALHEASGGAHG